MRFCSQEPGLGTVQERRRVGMPNDLHPGAHQTEQRRARRQGSRLIEQHPAYHVVGATVPDAARSTPEAHPRATPPSIPSSASFGAQPRHHAYNLL